MAFIPLGFAFAAKNKGLDDQFKRTRKAMGGLNADLDDMGRKGGSAKDAFFSMGQAARVATKGMMAPFKMTSRLLGGLEKRVAQFNLASIAGDMKSLTGEAGNLSDELDSAFASNAKAVRPLLAGIGKSGKELRKLTGQASSLAYSMDVSAETVGKVMVELETAGGPAKKGLDALNMSVSDFVKFTEVSGIETAKLGSVMGDMQTSWNMTDKQARATADAVLGYGQAAGIGTEGLKGLDGLMEKFNATLADAPPEMQVTAEQMQGMVIGATKLAGAYREMGASQEQAMEYSTQTAELFTKEAVAFQKAAEGRGEYGDMAKSLMPVLKQWGSWEEFGAALKVGALDSTKGMVQLNKIVQQASAKGFGPADVLMRQLLGTIQETSPSMAWLAQNTNDGRAALQKFDAMTVQTDGSIKKLGKDGFSTGFTLQERFDRARKGMDHAIRSIAGKEVQGMVKAQMGAYRDTGKEIVKLGKDKTWGPLLKKAVILKRMGVRGLFMSGAKSKGDMQEMGKTFAKMELAAGAIEDITGAASPLMNVLGKFGPMGTAIGGIATWFSMDQRTRDEIWASVEPLVKIVKEKLTGIWDTVWKGAVAKGKEYAPTILNTLWEGIKGIGGLIMGGIQSALSDPKIGIGAALLVGLKAGTSVGGKGGWVVALSTIAAGAIAEAYFQAQALIDERKKAGERKQGQVAALAGGQQRVLQQGYELQDWEREMGISPEESAAYAYGATESTDFAAKWKQDTAAQLAMVERGSAGVYGKLASEGLGIGGEIAGSAILAAQRARVKRDTGKGPQDLTWYEDTMSSFLDPIGIGNQTSAQMQGYGGAISTAQATPQGQAMIGGAAMGGPGQLAAMVESLPLALRGISADMLKISSGMGTGMMLETSKGIADNKQVVLDEMTTMQWGLREISEFHSPPDAGPLSAAAGNPLYNGGMGMMGLIADGIDAGAVSVQDAMAEALVNSYQYAMGKYAEAVQADLSVQGVMSQVADQIVANLSGIGRINMNDMQISTEEKSIIRASLDVPGMAGLAGAVIADGNLTRKILTRIADATEGTLNVLSGAKPNAKGSTGIVLAGA